MTKLVLKQLLIVFLGVVISFFIYLISPLNANSKSNILYLSNILIFFAVIGFVTILGMSIFQFTTKKVYLILIQVLTAIILLLVDDYYFVNLIISLPVLLLLEYLLFYRKLKII